ncbi:clustered mitochondria protein isoform X4 [Cinnamomum micranthum f. kanehirae]|uniref:Clustered mitochondria protein isoform X4 n=1 Tax=Cinnamomum micranthum f. kanehirae TaxID=337451 RepID=A0A443NWD9_9MAGN|nr:clustered mitochondria protein isoform X4 [Cinnamomum micranthum f. kanehirae]
MAGKSNRGKNRGRGTNSRRSLEPVNSVDSSATSNGDSKAVESLKVDANEAQNSNIDDKLSSMDGSTKEALDYTTAPSSIGPKQADGDLGLYPISVKTQSGEKLELQLNPGDSVMDLRQFLLEAPETCFFSCYDLILHAKDGSVHRLEDYKEISEVADITAGGCSLEMVAALYDDRSIRSHVRGARELLSLSTLHASLSTSLALQHEKTQEMAPGAMKEVPELDGLGFMEDISGSPGNLVSSSSKEIKCVESIVFSSFNPPPSYRRLVGDLIYLDVSTLEGHKFCITGTTKMFYVNSSSGNILDPRPAKAAFEATTLIGLLQKISSKFKKGFCEILDRKASAHPFENVQSLLPANSWLGILRDRALYKVTCDFVDAAISGAVGVINRCIPPINPTDPDGFRMYVHNDIFFSFAVDADIWQMSKENESSVRSTLGHDAKHSANTESLPDILEKAFNSPRAGYDSSEHKSEGSNKEELSSVASVISDVSSEALMADSEQATYASANNDLKGAKAYQEADIPGIYNLAMAIIDYRGHRVVAQSIIPGILQGDKSDSVLYGSVDNGKKIYWNEAFHAKVLEAAKHLHLKEHRVEDGSGNVVKLAAPVECKGIVGSDDRHYLLDLMRVTPRDANYIGPGSRFCVLRPELVATFCQAEAAERSKSSAIVEGKDPVALDSQQVTDVSADVSTETDVTASSSLDTVEEDNDMATQPTESGMPCKDVVLNPNVFTKFKLAGSQEEIAADEDVVRKAGKYLLDVVLPKFVQNLCMLEVSPMDGQTLTEALHAHGINVRYLGKIADMTKHLLHIWDLCVTEIVVRSAKHILKDVLRDTQDHDLGPAISHFFNCFLGQIVLVGTKGSANNMQMRDTKKDRASCQSSGKSIKGESWLKHGSSARSNQSVYMHITSDGLWSDIHQFSKFKYQFELPEDVRSRVRKVSVIRNLCQKVGIAIAARKYDLDAAVPLQSSDILNLQPVVKHSVPVCSEARNLVETGKAHLAEGMLNEAYTLFSEAFSILQQVTGPMHSEVANCCRYLAMVLYHAGDIVGAIMQQHKELVINERCLGLDHPDTAHSYGNMALFYHGLNQTELALQHMSRTLLLLSLSCGPDHPDVAATFINVAMMYQDIGKMNIALRYLQEALKKNERLLGPEHIQTAVCYHALAIAFNCMGAYKLSLQHEKKTYDILVKQLGEEDSRTRDSQNWIKMFKMRDLQVNAQKQKGEAVNAVSTQKAIEILKAHPDLVQVFQAAAGGYGASGSSVNKSINPVIMGETHTWGRGVDERAARATAEVRKKAAARGLLVRPHLVPVQAVPPLTQLLNINSGVASDAPPDAQGNEPNKEADSSTDNRKETAKENGSAGNQEGEAPVGLGTSLASLDSKKQRLKTKGHDLGWGGEEPKISVRKNKMHPIYKCMF